MFIHLVHLWCGGEQFHMEERVVQDSLSTEPQFWLGPPPEKLLSARSQVTFLSVPDENTVH